MPICHKRVKCRSSPWMCSEIIDLINERDKLKDKLCKLKFKLLEEKDESIRNYEEEMYNRICRSYKKLRNLVTFKIRKRKRNFYTEKLSAASSSGDVWNVLKSILPKSSSSQSKSSECSQDTLKAEKFNIYFANVGADLAANIPYVPLSSLHENTNIEPFSLRQVSEEEVLKILRSMKNKKSVGIDGISMYILKLSASAIISSLTHIINTSLSVGVMPLHWKQAKVIPLYKSGDKSLPSNYRPIAILSSASKIIEKLVQIQIVNHLKTNDLLSSVQSGFREKHSTITSLLRVTDEWLHALDNGLYTGVVFIDMRKAFDTVDPNTLFAKLKSVGVSDDSLVWFKSYLCNRKICTCMNLAMSDPLDIMYGVAQGSILGPLLFTVYINDIIQSIHGCSIHLYADDTVLYFSDKDVSRIEQTLNIQLKCIYKWMCSNKLSLNFDKTESLLIGSRKMLTKHNALKLQIQGKCIQPQKSVKYLGVVIDQQLKWDAHLDYICTKVSKLVKFLGRLRHYLNETSLTLIYRSIILPLFDYADVVYDSCNNRYSNQLQKLQNRAGRIILRISPYKHVSNYHIHQMLNWDYLACRRLKHTNLLVYKVLHDLSVPYLKESFHFISNRYCLRSAGNLYLTKPRTESCRRTFCYRGASCYNVLPIVAKSSLTYNEFVRELNKYTSKCTPP